MDLSPTTRFQIVKSDVLGTHKNTATDFSELANWHITNTNWFNDDLNKLDFTPTTDWTLQINKWNCFVKYVIDERVGRARFEIVNDLNENISSLSDWDYFVYIELNTSILIAWSSDLDWQDVWTLKIDITEPISWFYYSLYKVNKNSWDITLIEDLREKRKLNVDSVNQQETNLALKDLNDVDDNLNPISWDIFYNNWTERGAKQFDDLFDENIAVQELTNKDFYIWHNWVKGKSVFIEENITTTEADTAQNIWDVTWNTRIVFRQFWDDVEWNTFKVNLAVQWSPSVVLNFRIETDDNWQPSWNLVDANSTASIGSWSLTWTLTETTLTLWWNITITEWTPVWIVCYQWIYWSETVNSSNYYQIWYSTNQTQTRIMGKYNGSEYDLWLFVYKDFNWTTIDASYRINNWMSQNNSIYYYATNKNWNWWWLFVRSLRTVENFNRSIVVKWTLISKEYTGDSNDNYYTHLMIYFDDNNYITIRHRINWALYWPVYISWEIMLWWTSQYFNEVFVRNAWHDIDLQKIDAKIVYDKTLWDISFYYRGWSSRTQIWTTQTYSFSWTYKILTTVYFSWRYTWNAWWELRDLYLTSNNYAAISPIKTETEFIYINSDLLKEQLLSYTSALYSYKIDFYWILKNWYSLWQKALVWFEWINNDQNWITTSDIMYLSDTSWEIQNTKWTNECVVWFPITKSLLRYVPKTINKIVAGDLLLYWENNTMRVLVNDATPTKVKESIMIKWGKYTASWLLSTHYTGSSSFVAYSAIYKNWIQLSWTYSVVNNTTGVIKTYDFEVNEWDIIQLYIWSSTSNSEHWAIVKAFNIKYDIINYYHKPTNSVATF